MNLLEVILDVVIVVLIVYIIKTLLSIRKISKGIENLKEKRWEI